MFTGVIEGIGPRYCPSIEDKITRFAEGDIASAFMEPEGLNSIEVYPNGISTSLPFDVQMNLVPRLALKMRTLFARVMRLNMISLIHAI